MKERGEREREREEREREERIKEKQKGIRESFHHMQINTNTHKNTKTQKYYSSFVIIICSYDFVFSPVKETHVCTENVVVRQLYVLALIQPPSDPADS